MCSGIINIPSASWLPWLSEAKMLQGCLCGFDHRQSKETWRSFQGDFVAWKVRALPCSITHYRTSMHPSLQIKLGSKVCCWPSVSCGFNFLICIFCVFLPCPFWVIFWKSVRRGSPVVCSLLSLPFMFSAGKGGVLSVSGFSILNYVC